VDYATFARRRRPSADLFAALGREFIGGGVSSPAGACAPANKTYR